MTSITEGEIPAKDLGAIAANEIVEIYILCGKARGRRFTSRSSRHPLSAGPFGEALVSQHDGGIGPAVGLASGTGGPWRDVAKADSRSGRSRHESVDAQ
jgi:hypothetical protein